MIFHVSQFMMHPNCNYACKNVLGFLLVVVITQKGCDTIMPSKFLVIGYLYHTQEGTQ